MKKVVFCEVTWMKYYAGVTEKDRPKNGGKHIKENETGGEVYNFTPYNHKCYGYVMHYGDELHIERYDKVLKSSDEVQDMTVVWVASDGMSSKIVGWYEHAQMFRYWQSYYDIEYSGDSYNYYNFVADEKDCYLIDEKDRSFVIPRAPIAGKGRGMGQSQVWYADSQYAQNEFVPKVLMYLESIKDKCIPICLLPEELAKVAEDHGETTDELLEKALNLLLDENGSLHTAAELINLAIKKEDCYKTRAAKGKLFYSIGWYDEAEEEYKFALYHEEVVEAMADLMYVELMLGNTFLAIDLGEKIRKRKSEDDAWIYISGNLTFAYINEHELDAATLLIKECENDTSREYAWIAYAKELIEDLRKEMKRQ